MDILEAIKTRRSIRGYKPDPVPKEVLLEIMEIVRRTPSGMNTQPWEVAMVTGEVLDNIKKENMEALAASAGAGMGGPVRPYEGVYRQRQIENGVMLYELLDIKREDMKRRAEWWAYGIRYFEAPVAIFLYVEKSFPEGTGLLAIGSFALAICLAAWEHGLGTCIESQGNMFPDVIKKHTGIPESKNLVTSIAMGYPDWERPANKLITNRATLEDFVTWCGFK